jgi:hypothetical protein
MTNSYKSITILFILSISVALFSQIPNPGFELWTAGNPNNWASSNIFGFGTPVTQTSPGHSGSWALKGEVITVLGGDTLIPLIISGQSAQGFPVSERHAALTGYLKFSPVGDDQFVVYVAMNNSNNAMGSGALFVPTANSNFNQFAVPIEYFSGDVPDKCVIEIVIDNTQGGLPHPGSYYIVDDLHFSSATDINDNPLSAIPAEFELLQNYPNPFNPVTHIRYAIPQAAQVKLEVYNSLGQKVAELMNDYQPAGNHVAEFQAGSLPSGIYFYRITAGSYQKMMKMMLMK